MKRIAIILSIIINLFLWRSSYAQMPEITNGLNYLTSGQNQDGSWSDTAINTEVLPATVAVVETLKSLGLQNSPSYSNAQLWLQSQNITTTDFLAERIHALTVAGTDKDQLLSYLDRLSYAWGGYDDYEVNNLDTIMALQAMRAINYSDTATIGNALSYLMNSQNSNGGFGFRRGGESNTYVTALALETLNSYSSTFNVQSSLQKAVAHLLTKQDSNGGFGSSPSTIYETALAYKALAGLITDATVLGSAVGYLASTQSSDGSWNQDPYSTALALQALHFSETRPVTPPPTPTTGTVNGTAVDGSTGQPLSGVSVTLVSNTSIATVTDTAGRFSLANIPQGSQQVTFSLNGYAPSAASVTIAGGSIINLGNVPLSPASNTGIVQGIVTDASNGSSLSGVAITITGATTWTAVTAANGSYKITDITPGNITLSAGKSGFSQINGAGTVQAGGTLIFSPSMSTTPPTATTGELKGTVVDSATGLPLSGAMIAASGAGIYTASADASGNFSLSSMDAGSYTISVSSTGYGTRTYTVTIIAGTATNLGSIALVMNATTGTVQGKVTDASNGAPIAGAAITVTGSTTWTAVTSADGTYKITGIAPGAITISADKTGYITASGTSTVTAGGSVLFSPALSTTPPVETTGVLKGTVANNAGQPVSGATVSVIGKKTYTASTGPAGDFSVSAMDVDTYSVTVTAPGFLSQSYSVTILAGVTTDMGTVNLLPSPTTGKVSGIVTDSATGSALAGVTVSATGASTWQAVTGSDGTYEIPDVTPGAVALSAARTDYGTVTGTGTVTAGGTLTFSPSVLMLPTTGEVKGTVIDSSTGQAISGAIISLVTGTYPAKTTTTDATGAFSVNSLSPGNYTLTITATAHAIQTYTITIVAGTTTNIGSVGLSPALTSTTVSGRVTDAITGNPIMGADVMIMETNMSTTTNETGSYTLSGIPMLEFNLKASTTGYDSLMFIMSVSTHGTYTVDFPLNASHVSDLAIVSLSTNQPNYSAYAPVSIAVNVQNNGSALVSGTASVSIENAQGEVVDYIQATTVDANGVVQTRFDFPPGNTTSITVPWETKDLPPGSYTVVAKVITGEAGVGGGAIIIADGATHFSIDPTQAIASLVLTPLPQFTNLGASEQISLMAALANRSNVATELVMAYEWRSPSGVLLKSGTSTISLVPAESSKSVLLESFPFTFTESGDHPISVSIASGPTPASLAGGVVSAAPGIRIEPSQNITPAIVVPDGDKRIRLNIQIKGVEQK